MTIQPGLSHAIAETTPALLTQTIGDNLGPVRAAAGVRGPPRMAHLQDS